MSELHSLIRACKAEPDDDAPRLILADWLEEHGDAERAAFIRAQVARPDDASIEPNLEWASEWKRWADEWHATQDFGASYPLKCRRGFFRVGDYYRELYDCLPQLLQPPFDWTWLDEIQFGSWHDGDWTPLFQSPRLLDLNGLTFIDDHYRSVLVEPLATSRFVENLKHLHLGYVPLGDEGPERLSQSPFLTGLHSLGLELGRIGPSGTRALALSETWDRLRALSLRQNSLGDEGLAELASGRHRVGIRSLDVAHCENTDDGLMDLAHCDRFPHLHELYVGYHEGYPERPVFGRRGLESLLRSRHFRDVQIHLHCVTNFVPDDIEQLGQEFADRFFVVRVDLPEPP